MMGLCCEKSDYDRRDEKKAILVEMPKRAFFSMLRFKIHYCIAVCPIHPTDFVERVLCIVAGDDEADRVFSELKWIFCATGDHKKHIFVGS